VRVESIRTYIPMKMEQTECSETSAFKIQKPGNNPKDSIPHSKHGESLKSRSKLRLGRSWSQMFTNVAILLYLVTQLVLNQQN